MTEEQKITVEQTAGAVIFRRRGNKILYLLLQRPRGHWVFPGGAIEEGEESLDTARREIQEETGIVRVRFFPGYKEQIKFRYAWPPKSKEQEQYLKYMVLYLGEAFGGPVVISDEHKNFQWVSFEKGMKMLKHRNIRNVLEKAHARLERRSRAKPRPRPTTESTPKPESPKTE